MDAVLLSAWAQVKRGDRVLDLCSGNGIVPILVLFCCELLISGAALKSLRLRTLLFGRPSVLIRQGVIDQREMLRNRFTLDELMQELRAQGVRDPKSVAYGILETNGKLSLLLSPVKHMDLGGGHYEISIFYP